MNRRWLSRTGRGLLTLILGLLIMTRLPACEAEPAVPSLRPAAVLDASALTLPSSTATPKSQPKTSEDAEEAEITSGTLISAPEGGIPEHTMDIVLNLRDRRMQVSHYVLLENSSQATWEEVVFSVPSAYKPGVFTLDEVEVIQRRSRQRVKPTWDRTMLHIPLPTPLASREPLAVRLTYAVTIPSITPETWLPEGNLGAGSRVLQVGDWHPTLVPYRLKGGWQTWEAHPVGDPTVYPAADYDVKIFADPGVVIAAPGERTEEGIIRRFRLKRARAFAFLASPHYQVIESSAAGLPVTSYFLPKHAAAGQAVIEIARQGLPVYRRAYGPYPIQGLVIAENAYHGSMEYSGLISVSRTAYDRYHGSSRSMLVNLTVHEIAHQWWYHAVGNDQVREPWLDEAFAKYSELLYYEAVDPELVSWWWEQQIHRVNTGGAVDATIYDFESTEAYIRQVYTQGARFLDDLRALMGDTRFFDFARAYRSYGDGRLVTTEDFFAVLRTYTDADLTPLIDRYFSNLE